jgi:hypothetical protein
MLKRYAMAIVLTLFSVIPSVAGDLNDFFVETKKQAEQGDVGAQGSLCGMFYIGKNVPQNHEEALKWCTKAAEQGNSFSQGALGVMYQNGHGVSENYKEALKWYTKAAEQGDVFSQFSLGWTYETGRGTSQNYQEAIKWYTKASLQGYVMAQFNLGLMHAKGDGVPQSDEQAYIWASLATAQSDAPENAEKLRDEVAKKLPPKDLIAAQQRAAELQKQIEANQLEANQGKTAIQPPIRLPYYP